MEKEKIGYFIEFLDGYKQFRDKVDEILINFDFEKVHQTMKTLNWTWAFWEDREGSSHTNEVPDAYAIQCQAQHLLLDVVEKGKELTEAYGGFGGLEVECFVYDPCEDDDPYPDFEHSVCLSLRFVVEEYGRTY